MNKLILIGNDIVDINLSETKDKILDSRFLNRVFTENENQMISRAADSNKVLWSLWAAKETAYKIVKKLSSKTVFSHKKFEIYYEDGIALYDNYRIDLKWDYHKNYIHCVGINKSLKNHLNAIKIAITDINDPFFDSPSDLDLSPQEKQTALSKESINVRFLAKKLLQENNIRDVEIIRAPEDKLHGPPIMYKNKKRLPNHDISLSHHGQWIAVGISGF